MSQADKRRHEVRVSRQPSVGLKKLLPERIIGRMKNSYDAGDVNFRVFRERMVAVNEQRCEGQRACNRGVFSLHAEFRRREDFLRCGSASREEGACATRILHTCDNGFADAQRIVIQIELATGFLEDAELQNAEFLQEELQRGAYHAEAVANAAAEID